MDLGLNNNIDNKLDRTLNHRVIKSTRPLTFDIFFLCLSRYMTDHSVTGIFTREVVANKCSVISPSTITFYPLS